MPDPFTDGDGEISRAEHISPRKTGDNIQAKRVVPYEWNGTDWNRKSAPFLTKPYDTAIITYTDSTKSTIATVATKLGGVPQETLTLTSGSTTDTWARS